MRIISVGGGKGGVGKSVVALNLAVELAHSGRKTVLVDLDLGAANLHTLLGLNALRGGIGSFLYRTQGQSLAEFAVQTGLRNLSFISGDGLIPGIANLEHVRKLKILHGLRSLDADCAVLDLGAGTHFNVVDFFSITRSGIVVTLPEPTAVMNAYEFLKNVMYRMIEREFRSNGPLIEEITRFKRGAAEQDTSMAALEKRVEKLDSACGAQLRKLCSAFRPWLILNMCRSDASELAASLQAIARRFLNVEVGFLGSVAFDDAVRRSVLETKPLIAGYPSAQAAESLRAMARRVVATSDPGLHPEGLAQAEAEAAKDSPGTAAQEPAAATPALPNVDHVPTEVGFAGLLRTFFAASVGEMRFRAAGADSAGITAPQQAGAGSQGEQAHDFSLPANFWNPPLRIGPDMERPRLAVIATPYSGRVRFDRLRRLLFKEGHPLHPATQRSVLRILRIPAAHNVRESINALGESSPRTPEVGRAWNEAGMRLLGSGHSRLALLAFAQSTICMPDDVGAATNHAACLISANRLDAAEEILEQFDDHLPHASPFGFNRGLAHMARFRYEEAALSFTQVSTVEPYDAAARFLHAYCLYHSGNYVRAAKLYSRLVEEPTVMHDALFNLALSHMQAGSHAESIRALDQLLIHSPADAEAFATRGWVRWLLEDERPALLDLAQAISLKPANLSFRIARGYISYRTRKFDLAVEDVEVIVGLLPGNPGFVALLAEIKTKLATPARSAA